jgi:acetylornithine deacetylase
VNRDEAMDWARRELTELVEIASPSGREHEIVDRLVARCADLDLPSRRIPVDGGADDLIIGWSDAPALLLNAHVDTIRPTWAWDGRAHTNGDRVSGLGASDDKGGVVACLLALMLAREAGVPLDRCDVAVGLTVDEEHGGTGSIAMAEQLRPERVVVCEGTDLAMGLVEAGCVELWAHLRGVAVHGAMREEGVNAAELAVRLAAELLDLPVTNGSHPSLGRNDVMIWEIRGGQELNVTPDAADLHVDVRVVPGASSAADVYAAMREACDRFDADVELIEVVEPFDTPADAPFARALSGAAARVTGAEPGLVGVPAWTDAHNFVDVGGSQAIVYGPGTLRAAHHPDESVDVRDVVTCAEVLAELLAAEVALAAT